MLDELIKKARTIRSFDESRPVGRETLLRLVDSARLSPSARNAQPLKYCLVTEREKCEEITSISKFGGATPNLRLPPEGHHPTAYIVVLRDTGIVSAESRLVMFDAGLACEAITLRAAEEGLGGVLVASFDPARLCEILSLDERFSPVIIMAIGVPDEKARVVDMADSGSCAYYRDGENVNCVPKRALEDVVIDG